MVAKQKHKTINKSIFHITPIVHLFLFTLLTKLLLFKRTCGIWGPISGEIERYENPIMTARRETEEEIGISIAKIYSTGYSFYGKTQNGKRIHGITCFAFLPENITQENFIYNHEEISECLCVSQSNALSIMKNRGFPEAVRGLEYLKREKLIERVATAQEKSKTKGGEKNGRTLCKLRS